MSNKNNNISVSTLISLYANSLSSTLDGQIVFLEGFYSDNQGKLYGKYYYDEILDKDKQYKITTQISHSIKDKISSGSYYSFQGYVSRGQSIDNDSRIKVFFRVTKILKLENDVQLISKVEYDIIRARFNRDFPRIEDILLKKIEKEQKPIIDIIIGIQSTSQEDYLNQLKDNELYNIKHHNCNLSSNVEILEFLSTYDFSNTDLLIFLRGGGSGLEVFDEIELCKKAIELPIPFITGIGHYEDKTLLERVSDRGFSTPTSVGVFLQSIINNYNEKINFVKTKDLEMENYQKVVENEKSLLKNQIYLQKKTIKIIWIVLFVFLIAIFYLVFKFVTH